MLSKTATAAIVWRQWASWSQALLRRFFFRLVPFVSVRDHLVIHRLVGVNELIWIMKGLRLLPILT